MALKKSGLYSSLWKSCDELRGGMDASQYKDYIQFYTPAEVSRVMSKLISVTPDTSRSATVYDPTCRSGKRSIKQGMMQQLLTGKTRLPGFHQEWQDHQIGDHVTYVKTVSLSRAQLDSESPLRYLHYGDIHTTSNITLPAATTAMPRVSTELAKTAGRLKTGDLVFADASEDPAGVGKSVEITSVPESGIVPGLHTIAARLDKSILADGFKAYLQFIPAFRNSLVRLAAGTKVLATTRSYISSVTLSLPGINEQEAIAEILNDSDREIRALRKQLSKAKAMKRGMMQELLIGRTRLQPAEASA